MENRIEINNCYAACFPQENMQRFKAAERFESLYYSRNLFHLLFFLITDIREKICKCVCMSDTLTGMITVEFIYVVKFHLFLRNIFKRERERGKERKGQRKRKRLSISQNSCEN